MFNQYLKLIIFASFLISLCSCDKEVEKIPSYIYVDSISLNLNITEQGLPTHNFTEVLVFVGNNTLGVYPVPSAIPVLLEGTQTVQILPVIRENGVKQDTKSYPVMSIFTQQVDLLPTEVDTIKPVFKYDPALVFTFLETFNNSNNLALDLDDDPYNIQVTTDGALQGKSGFIALDKIEHPYAIFGSVNEFTDLPTNGIATYLELDYKNTIPFAVGLAGQLTDGNVFSENIVAINPRADWNKIYINLTNTLQSTKITNVRLFFIADLQNDTIQSGKVFIDNVKLVHF